MGRGGVVVGCAMTETIKSLTLTAALILAAWAWFSPAFLRGLADVLCQWEVRLRARADARSHFESKSRERRIAWAEKIEGARREA